jgi:hypothetical protein
MAKLADAADLKSAGAKALWGFDSPSRHQATRWCWLMILLLPASAEGFVELDEASVFVAARGC